MTTRTTMERATRLIRAATGEDYGDGYVVTDVITGYADGYDDDAIIVLGDWNDKRNNRTWVDGRYQAVGEPLTLADRIPSRLQSALERVGAECAWLDEWVSCDDCYKAIRTEPTSYLWTPQFAFIECGYVCAECMKRDIPAYLTEYTNNSSNAITWLSSHELAMAGYTQWEPGNEQSYQNGFHEGMNDNPPSILESIIHQHPNAEVVFLLDEASQFYVGFSAWLKDGTFTDDPLEELDELTDCLCGKLIWLLDDSWIASSPGPCPDRPSGRHFPQEGLNND